MLSAMAIMAEPGTGRFFYRKGKTSYELVPVKGLIGVVLFVDEQIGYLNAFIGGKALVTVGAAPSAPFLSADKTGINDLGIFKSAIGAFHRQTAFPRKNKIFH